MLACQPPSTHAPMPLFMCFLPGPAGNSYTKAADSTCGVSVEAMDSLRSFSKGEITPCRPLHVVASRWVLLDALSIVFESV